MTPSPPNVVVAYTTVLERAILNLRMRIRYGEEICPEELHDLMDAIHNIPKMLKNYGGWYVRENIDGDLARYDERWVGREDSKLRESLLSYLSDQDYPECRQDKLGGQGPAEFKYEARKAEE